MPDPSTSTLSEWASRFDGMTFRAPERAIEPLCEYDLEDDGSGNFILVSEYGDEPEPETVTSSASSYSPVKNFQQNICKLRGADKYRPDEAMVDIVRGSANYAEAHERLAKSRYSKDKSHAAKCMVLAGIEPPYISSHLESSMVHEYENFRREFLARFPNRRNLPVFHYIARHILEQLGEMDLRDQIPPTKVGPAMTEVIRVCRDIYTNSGPEDFITLYP